MPTIIASVANIVASSGIESKTDQVQTGGATGNTQTLASDVVSLSETVGQSGFIFLNEKVAQHGGASQTGTVLAEDPIESTAGVDFLVFPADFSRGLNLFGVIGTSGTIEKFYDRSPFFFTPSEIDPNIMRDISEAQQFLVFTQASIFSIDPFKHTSSSASLISVKGDEFSPGLITDDDIIKNGSFENGLAEWDTTISGGGTLSVIEPTGTGFTSLPVPEGDKYLSITKPAGGQEEELSLLTQQVSLNTVLDSDILRNISFAKALRVINRSGYRIAVYVRFLLNSQTSHLHRFQFSGTVAPPNSSLPEDLQNPTTSSNLGSFVAGNFVTFNAALRTAMSFTSFEFNEVEVSFVWINTDPFVLDGLLDDVKLTLDLPEEHLLKTSAIAHILTKHPVASGLPFTISESEDIIVTDETPPFFDEEFPVRSGTFNDPTNLEVSFHIKDAGSDVDQASINVFVDGLQVVTAGTGTTSSTWPVVNKNVLGTNNIEYTLTRSEAFPQQATVVVSGTFADLATPANGTTEIYQFTMLGSGTLGGTISGAADVTAPTIIPLEPVDLDTQISPNTTISWRLTDDSSGVDFSSVKFFLNGGLVLSDDVASEGSFSRTANSSRGFDYEYTPANPFEFGATVSGRIEASDFISNSSALDYAFTITPDDTLEIINFFLGAEESILLTSGTLASVEVVDFTYGAASGTTTLTVNGEVPTGLATTFSGSGPDRIIFTWPLEPSVDFREDLLVTVHAENNFPGLFPVIREQDFLLRPGYDVLWPNKDPSGVSIAEQVFPYLTNIFVNTEVKNFAKNFNTGSAFLRFFTEEQAKKDLGATIESNIKVANLPAALTALNPYFEYGKTMTLEVEVSDLEGNTLSFVHTFTIENKS